MQGFEGQDDGSHVVAVDEQIELYQEDCRGHVSKKISAQCPPD